MTRKGGLPFRRGKHDYLRVSTGLDGKVTLACECGQTWVCVGQSAAEFAMIKHATNPNCGDPRTAVVRDGDIDVDPSSIARPSWLASYLPSAPDGAVERARARPPTVLIPPSVMDPGTVRTAVRRKPK